MKNSKAAAPCHKPGIYITGSDGDILRALLGPDRIVDDSNDDSDGLVVPVPVVHDKFLLHRGIMQVLLEQVPKSPNKSDQELREQVIGQRVAKVSFEMWYLKVVVASSLSLGSFVAQQLDQSRHRNFQGVEKRETTCIAAQSYRGHTVRCCSTTICTE